VNLVLEWWYREQAEKLIRKRADELCARLGVKYGRLTIRGVKTRWGSCSHKGNLNFNWKLIMAPEPVVEHVIIHELAHLKEMNHAKRFRELVAELCPGWRDHKRWLKDHECMLSGPLRQLREGEEWTVSGGLSWLQGWSRVREGEESGCRKPGLDTTRLMAALES